MRTSIRLSAIPSPRVILRCGSARLKLHHNKSKGTCFYCDPQQEEYHLDGDTLTLTHEEEESLRLWQIPLILLSLPFLLLLALIILPTDLLTDTHVSTPYLVESCFPLPATDDEKLHRIEINYRPSLWGKNERFPSLPRMQVFLDQEELSAKHTYTLNTQESRAEFRGITLLYACLCIVVIGLMVLMLASGIRNANLPSSYWEQFWSPPLQACSSAFLYTDIWLIDAV